MIMMNAARARRGLARALTALALLMPMAAEAEFHVRSPIVEEGEVEFEHNGSYTRDKNPTKGGEQSYTTEIGWGATSWWAPELELGFGRDAGDGEHLRLQEVTFENTFQLTEQGKYWADLGFFAEYSNALRHGVADAVEFGPLAQKELGPTVHTLNLLLAKEIGPNHADSGLHLDYAWQSRWRVAEAFEPGFEIFGAPGRIDHFPGFQDQEHRIGPVATGALSLGGLGTLKYEAGYLFGLTRATADGTVRWKLEWETRF
jgi:hypothetical protein